MTLDDQEQALGLDLPLRVFAPRDLSSGSKNIQLTNLPMRRCYKQLPKQIFNFFVLFIS